MGRLTAPDLMVVATAAEEGDGLASITSQGMRTKIYKHVKDTADST